MTDSTTTQAPSTTNTGSRRFTDRVQNVWERMKRRLLGQRRHASLSYRYFCKLLEREFSDMERGTTLAISSLCREKQATNLILFLGYSLASELNARVLLVDTSLRGEHSMSSLLGADQTGGYLQLISGDEVSDPQQYIRATEVGGVSLLPSGLTGQSWRTIIDQKRLAGLLGDLSERFDFVIFQQGDISSDTRYMLLSEKADMNFCLVEENRTLMSDLDSCERLYRENQIEDLKLLLIS
ncbi:MAG: hypothetical protein AAF525_03455 [Pseudomonadota bacterium]